MVKIKNSFSFFIHGDPTCYNEKNGQTKKNDTKEENKILNQHLNFFLFIFKLENNFTWITKVNPRFDFIIMLRYVNKFYFHFTL